jgi:hypothetical protein
MFSSIGLHDWELIVVSGMCAVVMLTLSALIGATVAHIALREETRPVTVKAPAALAEPVAGPSYGAGSPTPVIGRVGMAPVAG